MLGGGVKRVGMSAAIKALSEANQIIKVFGKGDGVATIGAPSGLTL